MSVPTKPTREEVLDAFSVEKKADPETLEHYIRTYPEFAEDLIDLSWQLNSLTTQEEEHLTSMDTAKIETAWSIYRSSSASPKSDPFAALSATDLRSAAFNLGVPRQVLSAFREHRVLLSTVPKRFLLRLATTLNTSVETILSLSSASSLNLEPSRAYKADSKPKVAEQVSFVRLLTDAGVTDENIRDLTVDGE
ncbi:hypothetical protein HNQ77_004956 [Silvibacterium bohemicum]|uniref:Uncharacterized protein n=1 Tax=Silvibacterium bohemicum TaxID=1577686 RepID=A0A841K769_9BACT|nr:hypothetical protein [Silvibacterium bohemicum]MBB6146971.1 hypothetical protein [Silvibacterium bohemicum]